MADTLTPVLTANWGDDRAWTLASYAARILELWREAVEAVNAHDCEWRWVRGHVGHPQNEYANHLATRAAAEQTDSGGLRASEFESWLSEQQSKSQAFADTAPFPESETFKPSPKAWTT